MDHDDKDDTLLHMPILFFEPPSGYDKENHLNRNAFPGIAFIIVCRQVWPDTLTT